MLYPALESEIHCLQWPFHESQLSFVKEPVSLILSAVADADVSTCDCMLLKLRVTSSVVFWVFFNITFSLIAK